MSAITQIQRGVTYKENERGAGEAEEGKSV